MKSRNQSISYNLNQINQHHFDYSKGIYSYILYEITFFSTRNEEILLLFILIL